LTAFDVLFPLPAPFVKMSLYPVCSIPESSREQDRNPKCDQRCIPDEAFGLLGADPDVHPEDPGNERQRDVDER